MEEIKRRACSGGEWPQVQRGGAGGGGGQRVLPCRDDDDDENEDDAFIEREDYLVRWAHGPGPASVRRALVLRSQKDLY